MPTRSIRVPILTLAAAVLGTGTAAAQEAPLPLQRQRTGRRRRRAGRAVLEGGVRLRVARGRWSALEEALDLAKL